MVRDPVVDEAQTAACRRLCSAVIMLAVQDASARLSKEEKEHRVNLNGEACSALWFLFGNPAGLPFYASLLDMDPETVRRSLRDKGRGPIRHRGDIAWLNLQRRIRMYDAQTGRASYG